jgi:hypothetical protein
MSRNLGREVTTVAVGPYSPVTIGRGEGAWGLGDTGYDFGDHADATVVEYPDQASIAAAERPLGFEVALGAGTMARSVEVVIPEQGRGQ